MTSHDVFLEFTQLGGRWLPLKEHLKGKASRALL
jgi:hypothetical protein